MKQVVIIVCALMFAFVSASAIDPSQHIYGTPLPADVNTPLPIPPLRVFAIGVRDNHELLTSVASYCEFNQHWLAGIFAETSLTRILALCGMYIVATNAPYHEADNPVDALAFARQATLHCGTVVVAQGEIYGALGLTWRQVETTNHTWLEVDVDGAWEVFDATVNVWVNATTARAWWQPDFAGAYDHERYCHAWGCYNIRQLKVNVLARLYWRVSE